GSAALTIVGDDTTGHGPRKAPTQRCNGFLRGDGKVFERHLELLDEPCQALLLAAQARDLLVGASERCFKLGEDCATLRPRGPKLLELAARVGLEIDEPLLRGRALALETTQRLELGADGPNALRARPIEVVVVNEH